MMRTRLREWLKIEESEGPNSPKATDEEILNVLREEKEKEDGKEALRTGEITEELPLVRKTTTERLNELHSEGRVNRRRTGSAYMWSLADEEPETVVEPKMGYVVKHSSKARQEASNLGHVGRRVGEIGFVFLLIGFTIWISELALPTTRTLLLAIGYSAGLVGGATIGAANLLRLAGIFAPRLVDRFLIE